MRKIFATIARSGGILVFLILEAFSLFLVVQYNQKQQEIFYNSKSLFIDNVINSVTSIKQYYNLSEINDSLIGRVAELQEQQDNAKFENSIWRDSVNKKEFLQQYTYTAAMVVNNTINLPNNYLTLNRGKQHGIDDRTGVFSDDGIVGILVGSNARYSKVMSALHKEFRLSVEIPRNGAFGSLVWEGIGNPMEMQLNFVPNHFDLRVGDEVQTSGFSTHFPRGISVGTVTDFEQDQETNYYKITVRLSNDLSKTRYVYIVNNLYKGEQKEVEEGTADE